MYKTSKYYSYIFYADRNVRPWTILGYTLATFPKVATYIFMHNLRRNKDLSTIARKGTLHKLEKRDFANYGQFRGRSRVVAEVISAEVVVVGLIIEAITTTNTTSIMVMMMSTRQINMAHHVHYAVAIITPLNIVLRENMILMTSWRK